MSLLDSLELNTGFNIVIFAVIVIFFLYISRRPSHRAIISLTQVVHNAMRLTARSVMNVEARMAQRNREVLLAAGREAEERMIEREFERIDVTVRRDLSEYPAMHRRLNEEVTAIEEDYQASIEVPPAPPGWVIAVEAVANIPSNGDPMVGKILEDIHLSLIKANAVATDEYRKLSHKRHDRLRKMMPHWREVLKILTGVDKNVSSILSRSNTIDSHMEEYGSIVKGSDKATRMLSSSSLQHFFTSFFVMAIAAGIAMVNFQLIARPMSEMIGGTTSLVLGFQLNQIAAMIMILVEMTLGIFLMESLRITKLFPIVGALNDKLRTRIGWFLFAMLLSLATIEAGLGFTREILMQADQATSALLRGDKGGAVVLESSVSWITTGSQMALGFILPFVLMFVAIPFETFVQSLRTVLGIVMVGLLRATAWLLRLVGTLFKFSGKSLLHIYDLIIFLPLFIEQIVNAKLDKRGTLAAEMGIKNEAY
jgi:hypothetical protein